MTGIELPARAILDELLDAPPRQLHDQLVLDEHGEDLPVDLERV
jgi:hypothetical protein